MVKRLFDIICSAAGIFVLSPFLFWVGWRIKKEDGGPFFYRGERVGLNGKLCRIFKFRTMVVNAEKIGGSSTSDNDARITPVGLFLRKYKLDELPQLINVLVGDMSLVGPSRLRGNDKIVGFMWLCKDLMHDFNFWFPSRSLGTSSNTFDIIPDVTRDPWISSA